MSDDARLSIKPVWTSNCGWNQRPLESSPKKQSPIRGFIVRPITESFGRLDLGSSDVAILGPVSPAQEDVLSPDALEFVAGLQREFNGRRKSLLAARRQRQARLDRGELARFSS